ncbi:MAG TPA: ABC transporter substrate-binding protein [Galbitalea sp.]|nr:ABC transporter substrate-binding protein [Galbitalea sp.]
MNKRKLVAVIAVVGAAALALSACSSGTTPTKSAGKVTLTMWTGFTGGDRPGYAQIVKDFNASHPDIKVVQTVESWDTIEQKLPTAWLTGSGPDIAAPSSDPNVIANYVKTNSVLPIVTGSGTSKVNSAQLAPAAVKELTYNGKLYAIPANFASLSLYYNKKMFAAAGIANPPKTVAEFEADAKKLTLNNGQTQYGLSLADNQTIQMWPILQWLTGGDIVNSKGCSVLSSSASQAGLQTWADLVQNDHISPVGQTGAQADSLFQAGKAAMELNGPWAAPTYKAAGVDFGIATVPLASNGSKVTLGSIAPLAISAKTKYPAQAQEFLAYYTSKAQQEKFSLTTGFPPLRTDMGDDAKLKADPTVQVFNSQVPDARLYLPQLTNATEVDANGYVPLIGEITRGTSVATATAATTTTINGLTGCTK